MKNKFLSMAREIKEDIVKDRRYLHELAETGFQLIKTKKYVINRLCEMGYEPKECGKCGVVATVGRNQEKTFLLRADMDALPIKEETELEYASQNGNMHACGHDMHTAMLLGAAQMLKEYEQELTGTVKFMFQPAEELLEGAKDMIANGVLENPAPNAGLMIHVMPSVPFSAGTVIIAPSGVSAPAADYFEIAIKGKGCHGSMPSKGIDPVIAAAHTIIGVQTIQTREVPIGEPMALTIGKISGGEAANIIPNKVILEGSVRTFREEVREYVKDRLKEISEQTAKTYRAEATVVFGSGCPTLVNDKNVTTQLYSYLKNLFGEDRVLRGEDIGNGKMGAAGSEDFSYVSHQIPTAMIAIAAGAPNNGYTEALHHPKVLFDEEILPIGSAVYAYSAFRWLEENK